MPRPINWGRSRKSAHAYISTARLHTYFLHYIAYRSHRVSRQPDRESSQTSLCK